MLFPEQFASRPVNLVHANARFHRVHRSLLRFLHSPVNAAGLSRGATHMHSAGHIGTITGEYNTEVTDHESPSGEVGLRGTAVRQRGAFSGSNYRRKRHLLRPSLSGGVFYCRGHFSFSDAGTDNFKGAIEKAC